MRRFSACKISTWRMTTLTLILLHADAGTRHPLVLNDYRCLECLQYASRHPPGRPEKASQATRSPKSARRCRSSNSHPTSTLNTRRYMGNKYTPLRLIGPCVPGEKQNDDRRHRACGTIHCVPCERLRAVWNGREGGLSTYQRRNVTMY